MSTFDRLGLVEPLCRALTQEGYAAPTPIQSQAIPYLLEGRDLLGCAQTGTGKTAAFALPILQLLGGEPPPGGERWVSALVLTPTRELAAQIGESFEAYGRHLDVRHTVIFGGVNERPQIDALRRGVDVLIATPGRLLDLLGRGYVDLRDVEFFVLDEADRMLDMGFIQDVRKVLRKLPTDAQNLLFSATLPAPIVELARSFLKDPVRVDISPESPTVEAIDQAVMFVDTANKVALLAELLERPGVDRVLVFTRTKHGANRLAKKLSRGRMVIEAIHGNKSQGARTRALDAFKSGKSPVLVATDLASRGLDVEDVSHVFNYDLPNEPETYVHRIGRTGRAGRAGKAISFCDATEGDYLRAIEALTGVPMERIEDHAYHSAAAARLPKSPPGPSGNRGGNRGGRGGGRPPGGGSGHRRPSGWGRRRSRF